jgi:hypothetical protein
MPPPSAVVDGFDLVLAVRPGDGVRFDDPGIPATVLRGLLLVSHDASCRGKPSGRRAVMAGRRQRRRVHRLVAPLSDGVGPR